MLYFLVLFYEDSVLIILNVKIFQTIEVKNLVSNCHHE